MTDKPTNMGASVRARLLNLAQKSGTDFQLLLTRYVLERLLYRLSISPYREEFILKGAMLNAVWLVDPYRATRDLDLLGRISRDAAQVGKVFSDIFSIPVDDDGVAFDIEKLRTDPIREEITYGGIRITTVAHLGGARVPVQVDIGFGDAITPKPAIVDYPVLLDLPKPNLLIYPQETVVAEKFEAIVALGLTNSRMKDFHDIAVLAKYFAFDGPLLVDAFAATFKRRGTPLPKAPPPALTDDYSKQSSTSAQWKAFVVRESIPRDFADMDSLIEFLRAFLIPPTLAAAHQHPFELRWPAAGPWQSKSRASERH